MSAPSLDAQRDGVALSLDGFGVAFGTRVILQDVTFGIEGRSLTTLVGPCGSGKSTLLRTLAGLNDPHPALTTWGTATLAGRPLLADRVAAPGEVRKGIGLVAQHARFFVDSVRENLVSALPDRGSLDRTAQTERVTRVLLECGLEELVPRLGEDVASLPGPLQRRLAIARALVSDPPLLIADEPTADQDEAAISAIRELLREEAKRRAILLVTHHQRFARGLGGRVVLLAGGRVQEWADSARFWEDPGTDAGRSFVRTGGCVVPSEEASADAESSAGAEEASAVAAAPEPAPPDVPRKPFVAPTPNTSRWAGPRGFFWVVPDKLGGLPRPGVVEELEHDLDALQRLDVTTLVTLEETRTVPAPALEERGCESVHFPIIDMGVPTLLEAARLCRDIRERIARGGVVAVHCRAGLGRTGTVLAMYLVFEGESARGAIERVRRLEAKSIQSQAQVDFLSAFELHTRSSS